MKLILVHIGDIHLCPPIINMINILEELGVKTTVITTQSSNIIDKDFKYVKFEKININYENNKNILKKASLLFFYRRKIWSLINQIYSNESIIWCSTNVSLKYLGNKILEYKYVLHLMELSENLRYYYKLPFIELNKMKIGNSALAIVVPEYNRAHIIKAWWNLNNLPLLFHNKPYLNKVIDKKSFISDNNASKIMKLIDDRKIVLYQGILNNQERPLANYVKAIEKLGSNYAFVIMSNGENIYESIKSENYYFIPFVKPPLHLEITSHAYIGVLSYYASKQHYSDLNAVYCAPNKIFEYSMFGIPMIGNDIPGLKYSFEHYNSGLCVDDLSVNNICKSIEYIENNYDIMSKGSKKYYDSIDSKKEIVNILSIIRNRIRKDS